MAVVVLVEANEAFTHLCVQGNLDELGVGEVNLALTTQTVARRKAAIVDLSQVGMITSLGIGLLVSIARSMRNLKLGLVVIVGPTHVRDVLQMTNIDSVFPLVETREAALRALGVTD